VKSTGVAVPEGLPAEVAGAAEVEELEAVKAPVKYVAVGLVLTEEAEPVEEVEAAGRKL